MAALPRYLIDAIEAAGVDVEGLAASVGVRYESLLLDLTPEEGDRFILAGWYAVNDPAFGLKAGSFLKPERFGIVGFCCLTSASLRDAFARQARYTRLTWGDLCEMARAGFDTVLRVDLAPPVRPYTRSKVDAELSSRLCMARALTGVHIRPVMLKLVGPPPSYASEYAKVFECPVLFDQPENSLTFRNEDMDLELPSANPMIFGMFQNLAETALATEGQMRIDLRVRAALRRVMRGDAPTLGAVASEMCMSTRTLQRKLAEEGLSFTRLVDLTRKEIAEQYVTENRASMMEIAFMLGFADPPSFYRAFKRWTGTTPKSFREEPNAA